MYQLLVFFIYGLAFFIMGMMILGQSKKGSRYALSKCIWLLALFGIVHGIHEWIEAYVMLLPVTGNNVVGIETFNIIILILSFWLLFLFGLFAITIKTSYYKWLRRGSWLVTIAIMGLSIYSCLFVDAAVFWKNNGEILIRYFLGIPACVLAASAFLVWHNYPEVRELNLKTLRMSFLGAAIFMGCYAIFSGLIVRPAAFFPANLVNTAVFLKVIGIPVQLLRAASAVAVTICVVKLLKIFDLETSRKIDLEKKTREFTSALQTIAHLIEEREYFFTGHHQRVAALATAIAEEMHLDDQEIEAIANAALLHDVGKIEVPTEILNKPTALLPEEKALIRLHPQLGYAIIVEMKFSQMIAEIILQHHERLNGSGYPRGLKGDKILRGAKIVAVAETFDEACSYRLYKPMQSIDYAIDKLRKNKNILFDAAIVDICTRLVVEQHLVSEQVLYNR